MRPEPDIDTVDMKSMRANRECTDIIVIFELEQANGAVFANYTAGLVETVVVVVVVGVVLGGVEGERDGLNDGLVEAVRGVHVESVG